MTDEPALLAAAAAAPDDDTPRLVYADWLDDHGAADRAEFIRLQCGLARGVSDDPAAAERADELEEWHRVRWLAGVPTGPGLRWEFRRGFPERLEADAQPFLDRFTRVAAVPWLRDLGLTGLGAANVREFVSREWPPGWSALEVWGPAGLEDFEVSWPGVLAASPRVARLAELRLAGMTLGPDVVAALAASPHPGGLRFLAVPGDPADRRYAPLRARFGGRLVGEGV